LKVSALVAPVDGASVEERRESLASAIADAPTADLLVLPYQAVSTRFWRQLDRSNGFAYAERPPFKTIERLRPVIALRGIPALVSTYDVLGEGVFYSTVRLIEGNGEICTEYRQAHALNLPGHYERLFFQPGTSEGFVMCEVNGVSFGLLLGGDLWVPEVTRSLALAGAKLLVCISAYTEDLKRTARTLAEARSIENGLPVLLANREQEFVAFSPGAADPPIKEGNGWSTLSMPIAKPADDPLLMRRPRLYGSLGHGEEGAL